MTVSSDIIIGDCLEALRGMESNSVDSCVTDPPYGLSFMGKKWDYDVPSAEIWAECLRVLKPGGHLLAFAGTRTQHRMAVRIEDAGFEIRDMIAWVYGSGFPKSLNVANAIHDAAIGQPQGGAKPGSKNHGKFKGGCSDENEAGRGFGAGPGQFMAEAGGKSERDLVPQAQQWQGWGTALKPALEPITVARKPLIGTVAENVLTHGTGAINVDACRIDAQGETVDRGDFDGAVTPSHQGYVRTGRSMMTHKPAERSGPANSLGRWPANLIHDGSDEVLAAFPQAKGQQGDLKDQDHPVPKGNAFGQYGPKKCHKKRTDESKSAARFFYCPKASRKDRGEGNNHPTVKPVELMQYLCRLVTPPGGLIIDPFMGSGTTGIAAAREGFHFIGIEKNADYAAIARKRMVTC